MNAPAEKPSMPKGIANAYIFQMFNSFSFPIVTGMPMMLFLKRFGASATVLGVMVALAPLFNILQIPAAGYVERVGYRRFVLRGWAVRSVFILFFVVIAFLPASLDNTTKIVLTLSLLVFYNASRGVSVCGFLPWLTQLIPDEHRGTYISRDQMFGNISILLCSLSASFFLQWWDGLGAFGVLFFISFATAMLSLVYLKKMPDAPVPEAARSPSGVPWGAIVRYRPFRIFLAFDCLLFLAWAGSGVLQVTMMRDLFNYSDANFLMLGVITSAAFIVSICALAKLINRAGNKPFLAVSLTIQVAHMLGWAAVGAGLVPLTWWSVGLQQGSWGVAAAFFGLANTRMVMSIVPEMGRSHFFAVFSVGQSLVLGLCPVLWGLMLDTTRGFSAGAGAWTWNPYCLGYLLTALVMIGSGFILARVREDKAMSTDEFFRELLVNTPARALTRVLNRRSRTPL
ncbi:MAG: MFS transporter [Verrucomicrobiales bacterium]|jgi:MFS family permease|nr:MFS transporter [Verrucomicrobiales bacterium]